MFWPECVCLSSCLPAKINTNVLRNFDDICVEILTTNVMRNSDVILERLDVRLPTAD